MVLHQLKSISAEDGHRKASGGGTAPKGSPRNTGRSLAVPEQRGAAGLGPALLRCQEGTSYVSA